MRVGIYGGTFSPVHNGHVAAAKAFMEQMWLDILYVIPTGLTPHKDMKGDATAADRLEMCRLAFEGVEGVIVSDLEMRREGKSYTVDTLRELYDPDGRLFLLMGTDMLLTLDKWREPEEIFRLCYPVYIRREEDDGLDGAIVEKIKSYQEKYGKVVRRIVGDPIVVSSTAVRRAVAEGKSIAGMVPPAVEKYIRENGLYKKTGDVAQ
jgi:nicotinate-nucleotide adenylyltransferase